MRILLCFFLALSLGCGRKRSTENEPSREGASVEGPGRLMAPDEIWTDGDASVQITGAFVQDGDLALMVVISNDGNRSFRYRSWRENGAKLVDHLGAECLRARGDPAMERALKARWNSVPVAAERLSWGAGTVEAGASRCEALLFEMPLRTTKYVELDLEGKNVGWKSTIKFRILPQEWEPKQTEKPKERPKEKKGNK